MTQTESIVLRDLNLRSKIIKKKSTVITNSNKENLSDWKPISPVKLAAKMVKCNTCGLYLKAGACLNVHQENNKHCLIAILLAAK